MSVVRSCATAAIVAGVLGCVSFRHVVLAIHTSTIACEEWSILGTYSRVPQRVHACSRLLQDVPKLLAAVKRLEALAAANSTSQRTVDDLVQSLSATTRRLS